MTTSHSSRQPQITQKSVPQVTRGNTASALKQPQKQLKPRRRDGVGTRSTTTLIDDLDTSDSVTEPSPYYLLMNRKLRLQQDGMVNEATRIQAAVNVGMLLHWNESEVIKTVEKLEGYASVHGHQERAKARVTGPMMEVSGEEEVLGFERNVREEGEDGWERLRFLRESFAPDIERLGGISDKVDRQLGVGGHKRCEVRLYTPLLLIKIQAALNVAFDSSWKTHSKDTGTGTDNNIDVFRGFETKTFDVSSFKQKATYLLRVPSRHCGEKILDLLRCSKLGRKRFGDVDNCGRAIAMMPGIERPLTLQEKVKLLGRVKSDLGNGRKMLQVLVEVLGRGETVQKAGNASGWIEGGLSRRAMAELSDEGFLVVDSVYRNGHGQGVLIPDYVTDGEEEEVVESEDENHGLLSGRVGGIDGFCDATDADEEDGRTLLKVKLKKVSTRT